MNLLSKCDLQVVEVKYKDYNDMTIKEVRINVDEDRYKILKHIDVPKIVDGEETVEQMVEYKVVDDRMMFEMTHIINQRDLRALIKALQQLYQQMNVKSKCN